VPVPCEPSTHVTEKVTVTLSLATPGKLVTAQTVLDLMCVNACAEHAPTTRCEQSLVNRWFGTGAGDGAGWAPEGVAPTAMTPTPASATTATSADVRR